MVSALFHLPEVVSTVLAIRRFRRPFRILHSYVHRTCPKGMCIETRAGARIFLSGDQDDVVTLLIVPRDYGPIPQGGIVIDVGAHLGGFTLLAAPLASRVFAYEPDPHLYSTLQRNIAENGHESKVTPCQAAVVGESAGEVTFYREGNASGHVDPRPGDDPGINVKSLTLEEIIVNNGLHHVDLLKLDCEGSEYGIVRHTPKEVWERIQRVRLEYHMGTENLKQRFRELGYTLTRHRKHTLRSGLLWFDRVM